MAALSGIAHVPPEFICPLSGAVLEDPVMIASGENFSRDAIEKHFMTSDKNPLTGFLLANKSRTSITSLLYYCLCVA
jgi:hypothetical protein